MADSEPATLKLPRDLRERLRHHAFQARRSMSDVVVDALREYFAGLDGAASAVSPSPGRVVLLDPGERAVLARVAARLSGPVEEDRPMNDVMPAAEDAATVRP